MDLCNANVCEHFIIFCNKKFFPHGQTVCRLFHFTCLYATFQLVCRRFEHKVVSGEKVGDCFKKDLIS